MDQSQDKSSWLKQLLRDHEGALLRHAQRFVGPELARDIVQESFMKLWKEDAQNLKGREKEWLFCVCRNMAIDSLRKSGRLDKGETEFDSIADERERADQRLEREQTESDQKEIMMRRMKRLNKNQEEVIRLKFVEGFGYKEISSITGHSVSHVGVLIHEAMKILKGASAGQGGRL